MRAVILFGSTLALAACVSGRQPPRAPLVPLEPPPAPAVLTVAYVRDFDGQPLGGLRAYLVCCLDPAGMRDTLKASTDRSGILRFTGFRPGHYVLWSTSIGYRARRDTLVIGSMDPPKLQVTMRDEPLCLGSCPPNPRLVSAARARRDEWGCDTDQTRIREQRDLWASTLSDSVARAKLKLTMSAGQIAKRVVPITERTLCLRAAQIFDRWGTISTLDFMLFRFGKLILVSPANQPWVLLVVDQRFETVANFSVLQE